MKDNGKGNHRMGLFFENIHIHKNMKYNIDVLKEELINHLEKNGFELLSDDKEGSVSVVIYEPDSSDWVSVASDIFQFDTEEGIRKVAEPISQCFETDIISAGCYDSDYLRLSILNITDGTDGWINVGRSEEIKNLRRTSLTPWKKIVDDIKTLNNIVRDEYVFAEEAFGKMADLIKMSPEQTVLDVGHIDFLNPEKIVRLEFLAPEGTIKPPKLVIPRYDLMPCQIGKSQVVSVYNSGGKSKGLGIMFIGDYVDNDEIAFEDVKLQLCSKEEWKFVPVELKKVDWAYGKKCYYWSDPDFPLPPAVNENVPPIKRMNLEFEREIGIRFTPVGNQRKVLDIRIVVYPLANSMDGQTSWYVYRYAGSKRNYIEEHNESWKSMNTESSQKYILDPNDYDLE